MTRVILVVALLVGVAAGPARAQEAPNAKQAKAFFKQGKKHFDAGEWQQAIDAYKHAYELSPEPILIFNIGLAYHRMGEVETAYESYKQYLELDPSGPVADEARDYVAELTPQVEALRAERERVERERREEEERRRREEQAAEEERERERKRKQEEERAAAERRAAERRAELRGEARWWRWGAYAAGGAAVLSLAATAKYGLDARAAEADVAGHTAGPWTDELLARDREGRAANAKVWVFSSVAAGCALGGAYLYWRGWRLEKAAVSVVPEAGGASVVMTTTF